MKSVIFVAMCAVVGAIACGGSSESGWTDGGFTGDPHARVTCGSGWMDNLQNCEAACETPVSATGPGCSSASSGSASGRCDATFEVNGQAGCCQVTGFGPGLQNTVRVWLVCQP